jgi:head-tail adaptor
MMRAGSLDRTIIVQRPTTTLDLYGVPATTWATVATMRAQLRTYSKDDRTNATDETLTFRCRWLDSVTLEHRVSYQGEAFKLAKIVEIGRRVGLDLTCEHVGP